MNKYRIDYQVMGLGNFFVEADSLSLAYEEMYKEFNKNNGLIVHAKYPYGFEILQGVSHEAEFSKPSKFALPLKRIFGVPSTVRTSTTTSSSRLNWLLPVCLILKTIRRLKKPNGLKIQP